MTQGFQEITFDTPATASGAHDPTFSVKLKEQSGSSKKAKA
ncbi:hypothetical protein [Dyadobacter sp.]|nr:hypothetical protein [Dyadobacter sp.]